MRTLLALFLFTKLFFILSQHKSTHLPSPTKHTHLHQTVPHIFDWVTSKTKTKTKRKEGEEGKEKKEKKMMKNAIQIRSKNKIKRNIYLTEGNDPKWVSPTLTNFFRESKICKINRRINKEKKKKKHAESYGKWRE